MRILAKKQAVECIINIRKKHHLTITSSDAFDFIDSFSAVLCQIDQQKSSSRVQPVMAKTAE